MSNPNPNPALAAPQQAFAERYAPQKINDLVFPNLGVQRRILAVASGAKSAHLLLHGGTGTGKTSACKLIAEALVTKQHYSGDVLFIDASTDGRKDSVVQRIENFVPLMSFNETGKRVVIVDECDCLSTKSQDALKGIITHYGKWATFLFTTNHLGKVDAGIRSRAVDIYFDGFTPTAWLGRAQQILTSAGVTVSPAEIVQLLTPVISDNRKVYDALEDRVLFGPTLP